MKILPAAKPKKTNKNINHKNNEKRTAKRIYRLADVCL